MARKKKDITPASSATGIHFGEMENERMDYQKYYKKIPDKDFSPQRNKAVVEDSIRKTDALQRAKHKIFMEALGERIEAATSYIMHLERGYATSAESFFGKAELARLRGQRIAKMIRNNKIFLDSLDDNEFLNG